MTTDLRGRIAANLSMLSDEDLLEAWVANDRTEWSETAFEVIVEILSARGITLPPQGEPVYEHEESDLAEPNAPLGYSPAEVVALIHRLNKAAPIAAVAIAVIAIPGGMNLRWAVASYFTLYPRADLIGLLIAVPVTLFLVALQAGLTYFALKSLAAVLGILMEMELNSRSAARTEQDA